MTQPKRTQDLLREMRRSVASVVEPDVSARREQTVVERMRQTQARELSRRGRRATFRRRVAAAALVLVPSGALAAVWFGAPVDNPVRQSVAAEVSHAVPPAIVNPAKPHPAGKAVQAAPVTESAPSAAGPTPVQAHRARRQERPAPVAETPPSRVDLPQAAAAFPAESTLAAENALLQSAMIAARSGDAARAVDLLDHLLTRYPSSPLAQSARAQRTRVAARLRVDELSTSLVPPSP